MKLSVEQVVDQIVKSADEKKGINITSFNMTGKSIVTDYVILISVKNTVHCKAMMEDVKGVDRDSNDVDFFEPPRRSGTVESGWLIIDLNSILIHIILEDLRDEYALDRLYEDYATPVHHTSTT